MAKGTEDSCAARALLDTAEGEQPSTAARLRAHMKESWRRHQSFSNRKSKHFYQVWWLRKSNFTMLDGPAFRPSLFFPPYVLQAQSAEGAQSRTTLGPRCVPPTSGPESTRMSWHSVSAVNPSKQWRTNAHKCWAAPQLSAIDWDISVLRVSAALRPPKVPVLQLPPSKACPHSDTAAE